MRSSHACSGQGASSERNAQRLPISSLTNSVTGPPHST
jgi:hypothetical protein